MSVNQIAFGDCLLCKMRCLASKHGETFQCYENLKTNSENVLRNHLRFLQKFGTNMMSGYTLSLQETLSEHDRSELSLHESTYGENFYSSRQM